MRHDKEMQQHIQSEQTRQLYETLGLSAGISLANALILALITWQETNQTSLTIWTGLIAFISLARFLDKLSYNRHAQSRSHTHWKYRFNAGTFASGIAWGGAVLLIMPFVNTEYQLFATLILAGNCAGAATTLSHTRTSLFFYLAPILIPLSIFFATQGTQVAYATSLLTIIFFAFIALSGLRNYQNNFQNIELKLLARQREKQLFASEARFRSLVENASDAFFLLDLDGNLVDVNKNACSSLGYSREELLQKKIQDLELGIEKEQIKDLWPGLSQLSEITIQGKQLRKDGSSFPTELKLSPITDQEMPMMLALSRDITYRKQNEEELLLARDAAETASRAKSEFLSRMSHELRTPMNIILGFGQLLETEKLTADQKDSVKEIINAGNHLLDLINEILDLSRVEAGKMSITLQSVSLPEVLEDILNSLSPMIRGRELHLQCTLNGQNYKLNHDTSDNLLVSADKVRLRQILYNLISNAIKYNRERGDISIDITTEDKDFITIAVTDTGKGLSKDEMENLFTPFNRLGAEFTSIEGTGIGLVITRKLVELMGGTIGVESEPDAGSQFWFRLENASKHIESA